MTIANLFTCGFVILVTGIVCFVLGIAYHAIRGVKGDE